MSDITVIYGSSTGSTEAAAQKIAEALGANCVNIARATAEDFNSPLLILGTPTWGDGELQDDWQSRLSLLQSADLSNTTVALFGLGDQFGFSDTYLDGMGLLYAEVSNKAMKIIGKTSSADYSHSHSKAEQDGEFCGLALDDVNEPEKTELRIGSWIEQIRLEN